MNFRKILALSLLAPAFLTPGASARHNHTTTLLPDGNILIAGGTVEEATVTGSVEMYDMASNLYVPWNSNLITARSSHTATLMSDGRVLIAGGFGSNGQPLTALEICDPVARTCDTAGVSMTTARGGHTATLLSKGLLKAGRVLLCGGQSGASSTTITGTCELFNPSGPAVSDGGSMVSPRVGHAALLLRSGRVFVTGGKRWNPPAFLQEAWTYGMQNEMYDPSIGLWTPVSALNAGRVSHTATVLNNGKIMIAGGYNESNRLTCRGDEDSLEEECWHIKHDPLNAQNAGNQGYLDGEEFFDQNGARVILQAETDAWTHGEIPYRVAQHSALLEPDGRWRMHGGYGNIYPTFFNTGANLKAGSVVTRGGWISGPNSQGRTTYQLDPASIINLLMDLKLSRPISGRLVDGNIFLSPGDPATPTFTIPYINPFGNEGTAEVYMVSRSTLTMDGLPAGTLIGEDAKPGDFHFQGVVPLQIPTGDRIIFSTTPPTLTSLSSSEDTAYNVNTSTVVVRGMVFSSELSYSPKSNKWGDLTNTNELPPLRTPSFNHTAMLTPAADTVILGGRNCEFNPAADCLRPVRFSTATITTVFIPVYKGSDGTTTWPAGRTLNSKRAFHTSTLLPDGRILTCGGSDGVKPLATCELMDPVTKEWTPTGSMNLPRSNHTATLLPNGNVLAAGGITPFGIAVSSAEIYYPDAQRWVPTKSLNNARQLHTATLMPDGNVLVTGGATLSTYSATAEIYISSTAEWINGGAMVYGRSQHTATLLKNGNVLIAGGVNGIGAMKQTEIYDYLSRTFSRGMDLTFARYGHTANQLRNGNVIVVGGSDGINSIKSCEINIGQSWWETAPLHFNRANHRSVLLPNGKIMLTGGDMNSTAQSIPESFDPDYRSWSKQGLAAGRTNHTSVLTRDNLLINIGGWSGGNYLDSTEYAYFNFYPDMDGLEAEPARQPLISTGTNQFNQGAIVTLLSGTSNFHGITEASGGGAGPANSSYHNPRVYMQQIDNQSGFMIDLSTRIYSWYGGIYNSTNWETTLSSITITMPTAAGELPHGYYHMRVAANGQFSEGFTVQVSTPRSTGFVTKPVGSNISSTSIQWDWRKGSLTGADGYAIFSSSNDLRITTAAFTDPASYTQTNLTPNTEISVKIGGYNTGGNSTPLIQSDTYYTNAVEPSSLTVVSASFETVTLTWDPMGNSPLTIYEVTMSKDPGFDPAVGINTPVPFTNNHTSTSAVISGLLPTQLYTFRVQAKSGRLGSGTVTAGYSNYVTTMTVSNITNLSGAPQTMSEINWSWNPGVGAPNYEIYDVTAGTGPAAIFLTSTTVSSFLQTGLSTNTLHAVSVNAYKDSNKGPPAYSDAVYTLAVPPLHGEPNIFTKISTNSLTLNWIANGNPAGTVYSLAVGLDSALTGAQIVQITDTSSTISGLTPNTLYYAGVSAKNGDGVATLSTALGSEYTFTQVPTNLIPTGISMSGIGLAWSRGDNPGDTTYEVRGSTIQADLNSPTPINISTYMPFSQHHTANDVFISGLLTASTYYFDVAAWVRTSISPTYPGPGSRIPLSPPGSVLTLAGPGGCGSGCVAGTSNPRKDVTISGTLLNGRKVSLYIPAAAFASQTAIAISSSSANHCASAIPIVEVAIWTDNDAQPQVPVTLTLDYNKPATDADTITPNIPKLVMARYNPVSGECLPLDTTVDPGPRTITAKLNHFSFFQLMIRSVPTDLSGVRIYPNPFYTNRGQGFVTINNVPAGTEAAIYTLSGDKVWEGTAGSAGMMTWDATNNSGVRVASGIYLAALDSTGGKKVFKIAVER